MRLLLVLALCFGVSTARAVELIVNYPSAAVLISLATSLGYYVNGKLVDHGNLNVGSYFINVVGPVPGQTGLWLRIRHNGNPALLDAKMTPAFLSQATSAGVVIYQWQPSLNSGLGCWASDGATCAPASIAIIGLIM